MFSIFRFPSPIALFARILFYKYSSIKNKRYGFFSISLVLFSLIETGWNLPCKQVLRIMKRLRHGKHLSMISFLPTQCMIFSTRFVVQNVKDFHPCKCKPIRKTATSHTKQKRYSFHPYRLMFIFCQCRWNGFHRAFSLLESVHRIAPPASSLFGKLLHPRKAKRYSFHPYRLMFIFSQRRRHDCRRAFSLLESVHRIAPPASSLFEKLLHSRKAKRYSFHPYRLMFIFSQRRQHGCHMAFSLPESVHQIALPMRTHEK